MRLGWGRRLQQQLRLPARAMMPQASWFSYFVSPRTSKQSVTFLISSGQADVKRPLDGNTESRITRIKSHLSDLNREPRDYKSRALPVELRWRPAYSTRN